MLRPLVRFGVRASLWALVLTVLAASSPATAQSFFEKLFGLGDPRPQPMQASPQPRPATIPVERSSQSRSREARGHGDDAATGGGIVQTMCVRSCDGYYWPVHYPVSRRDVGQDADICQASCGAEAKLYTRAGPGTEAEEMRDAAGQSYGASATAFLYRKGLVNGCSCRPMPWSDGERARHEGYALAQGEAALRVAQAEAEKAAEAKTAVELAETNRKLDDLGKAVALASAGTIPAEPAVSEPAIGPAEAAAIAAFGERSADASPAAREAAADPRKSKRGRANDRERQAKRPARVAAALQRPIVQRLPRGAAPTPPQRNAVLAASGPKFWWAQ